MFTASRPLVKSVHQKIIFLFLNQKICCGYSKVPSQWDGSFEHPKHMLKLMGKKIFTTLHSKNLFKPELQGYLSVSIEIYIFFKRNEERSGSVVECLIWDNEVHGLSLTPRCVVPLARHFILSVAGKVSYAEVSGYRAGYSGIFSIIGIIIF